MSLEPERIQGGAGRQAALVRANRRVVNYDMRSRRAVHLASLYICLSVLLSSSPRSLSSGLDGVLL